MVHKLKVEPLELDAVRMQRTATERQVASPRAGRDAEGTPDTVRKQPKPDPQLPPKTLFVEGQQRGKYDVEGPTERRGLSITVPDLARNVDGRLLVRFQMPQPARPEFYVESDVEPGAVLVVSVESRVYAVERKAS